MLNAALGVGLYRLPLEPGLICSLVELRVANELNEHDVYLSGTETNKFENGPAADDYYY